MVNFLLALPVAILGFTVASSLAAALGENAFWLLGAGLTASVIFPSLVASWLRALRKGNRIERSDGGGVSRPVLPSKSPTTSGTILVLNLCIILGSALLAPALTRTRLTQGGAWWVREAARLIAPVEADEITAKGEKVVGWFASMLPGGPAASSPNKLTLPGEVTGDGGVNTAPDLGPPRADGHEALMEGEELLISFQREGSAVVVPVWFSGPSGTAKVKMIFDTGATLTTLNRATLRSLGLVEDPSAPTVISHTANGTVRRRLTVVDGAALGSARVARGLTVAICDACATGKVVGLLGLNFTRNFKVSMDHEEGRIGLVPKLPPPDHTYDARHFIKLDGARGLWRGSMLGVDLVVRNLAPRALRDVRITAEVGTSGSKRLLRSTLKEIPAHGSKPLHMQGMLTTKGKSFKLKIEHASW